MRVENIVSEPVKATYKYGVYCVFGFCALSLIAFVAWSATCVGGAAIEIVSKLA